jgi:hypothetical protein
MMKFDTKTAFPLPSTTGTSKFNPNCYVQVNEYIRCEQTSVATAVTPATPTSSSTGNKDKLGRDMFYEPHIFFSPVLASQRVVDERHGPNSWNYNDNQSTKSSTTPSKKRLMTAEGVNALTQQLDALCLGGSTVVAAANANDVAQVGDVRESCRPLLPILLQPQDPLSCDGQAQLPPCGTRHEVKRKGDLAKAHSFYHTHTHSIQYILNSKSINTQNHSLCNSIVGIRT